MSHSSSPAVEASVDLGKEQEIFDLMREMERWKRLAMAWKQAAMASQNPSSLSHQAETFVPASKAAEMPASKEPDEAQRIEKLCVQARKACADGNVQKALHYYQRVLKRAGSHQEAVEEITRLKPTVADKGAPAQSEATNDNRIPVTEVQAARIIGTGAMTLKNINDKSGAYVKVVGERGAAREIVISGTDSQKALAKRLVQAILGVPGRLFPGNGVDQLLAEVSESFPPKDAKSSASSVPAKDAKSSASSAPQDKKSSKPSVPEKSLSPSGASAGDLEDLTDPDGLFISESESKSSASSTGIYYRNLLLESIGDESSKSSALANDDPLDFQNMVSLALETALADCYPLAAPDARQAVAKHFLDGLNRDLCLPSEPILCSISRETGIPISDLLTKHRDVLVLACRNGL